MNFEMKTGLLHLSINHIYISIYITSISFAPSMNFEMTTGWSGETSQATARNRSRSLSEKTTFIAAPERTYEGRIRQG